MKREFDEEVERSAANWTIRLDRGLSAEEQDEYMAWLAGDPNRREAMKLFSWSWAEFDRLSGLQSSRHAPIDPNLLEPGNRFSRSWRWRRVAKWAAVSTPLAASIGILFLATERRAPQVEVEEAAPVVAEAMPVKAAARIEKIMLPDGSEVELNRGARIDTQYSDTERRLRLVSGEANFKVAKNPDRPFLVEVGGVTLRALGTVFNVKSSERTVDLIVTEGRVQVETKEAEGVAIEEGPVVMVGQRALVKEEPEAALMEVFDMAPEELEEALLWQPRMLDFDAASLGRIVEEFNRRNSVKILIRDPEVAELSLSCSFWSDNVDGFVRLMELSFNLEASQVGEDILLNRGEAR